MYWIPASSGLRESCHKGKLKYISIEGDLQMKTPILETERLILRPLCADDAEDVFQNWTSDADVARFMRWEVHKSVVETRQWLLSDEALIDSDEVYNWGFVLKLTGELIGSGGLVFQKTKGMYELGYCIMKKYWNQGITTEAASEIIDFGKNVLKQTEFYCCHAKENPASGSVMRKVGFQYQCDGFYDTWNQKKRFLCSEYLLSINGSLL